MQEDTAQKILSDPDFNPAGIWADALMEYMTQHPTKVAGDAIAMKHLVRDPTVAPFLVGLIDMNNIDQVSVCLRSISKCESGHLIWPAAKDFWQRMPEVRNPTAIEDIIVRNIEIFAEVKALADHKLFVTDRIVKALIESKSEPSFEHHKAWRFLTRYTSGALAFVKHAASESNRSWWMHAERKKMNRYKEERKHGRRRNKDEWEMMKKAIPASAFQNFSTAAASIKQAGSHAAEILNLIDTLWPNHYVCFKCGKGSGMDLFGCTNEKKQIKSKSGYTIHRQKCDPVNEFPSPHEIFFGEERDLEFPCRMCGATFTSASGKTLHEKRCWIG